MRILEEDFGESCFLNGKNTVEGKCMNTFLEKVEGMCRIWVMRWGGGVSGKEGFGDARS